MDTYNGNEPYIFISYAHKDAAWRGSARALEWVNAYDTFFGWRKWCRRMQEET